MCLPRACCIQSAYFGLVTPQTARLSHASALPSVRILFVAAVAVDDLGESAVPLLVFLSSSDQGVAALFVLLVPAQPKGSQAKTDFKDIFFWPTVLDAQSQSNTAREIKMQPRSH